MLVKARPVAPPQPLGTPVSQPELTERDRAWRLPYRDPTGDQVAARLDRDKPRRRRARPAS